MISPNGLTKLIDAYENAIEHAKRVCTAEAHDAATKARMDYVKASADLIRYFGEELT